MPKQTILAISILTIVFQISEATAGSPSPNDILGGKGFFTVGDEAAIGARVETVKAGTEMPDWTLLFASRYEVGTQTETMPNDGGDATAMNLKKLAGEGNFAFDDGLIIQFPSQKPKQLSFYCKSDNVLGAESCDVKLLRLNNEES